jgi:hypothetical protein
MSRSRRRRTQTRRGEHKKHSSPEAQRWARDHLIPERPSWMAADVYVKLARLRDGEGGAS